MIPPADPGDRDPRCIVVALGGNALQPGGESGDYRHQFAHARESLGAVVALARRDWHIAIVHGNGPQIGDALLRNELAHDRVPPLPLGMLVAATAGWIGYMIQQSLRNALDRAGVDRSVVTLISQVLVDPAAAAGEPVKPIGRVIDDEAASARVSEHGWAVGPVSGGGWRRLVPSPHPLAVIECVEIRELVTRGVIVITAGGGGTPVFQDPARGLEGADVVIDKDRAAAVLGRDIGAAVLLILTNVEGAYRAFGTPQQELLRRLSVAAAEQLLAAGEFGRGSMGPKIEAATAFVRDGGSCAIIAQLDRAFEAVRGETGTSIVA